MTVIVYRDGILAADSRAYSGNRNPPIGQKLKIRRLDDGRLLGASSNTPGGGEDLLEWIAEGRQPYDGTAPDSFTLLEVTPAGLALFNDDSLFTSGPITAPFFAIGSGAEYALGALHMGATAVQAVRVACRLDTWSAEPIDVVTHTGRISRALKQELKA